MPVTDRTVSLDRLTGTVDTGRNLKAGIKPAFATAKLGLRLTTGFVVFWLSQVLHPWECVD